MPDILDKLNQQTNQPYNWQTSDWSNPLIQFGAGLASSSNPQQAAVLQAMARGNQQNQMQGLTLAQQRALQMRQMAQQYSLQQQEMSLRERLQNQQLAQTYQLQHNDIVANPDGSRDVIDKTTGKVVNHIAPSSQEMQSVPGIIGTERQPRFLPIGPGGQPQPVPGSDTSSGLNQSEFLASLDKVDAAIAAGKPADEVYGLIPQVLRPNVQARIEGRQPSMQYSRSGDLRNAVDMMAQHVDPGADFTTYAARQRLRSDFSANTPQSLGGQLESLDAVSRHGHELNDAYDQLFQQHPNALGRNLVLWNTVQNKWENAIGYPEVNRIVDILNSYSGEKARYLTGKAPSDEARHEATQAFATANSPDQIKAAIAADGRLLRDKYEGHEARWTGIMGSHVPMPVEGGLVSKRARDDLGFLIGLDPNMRNPSTSSPGVGSAPGSPTQVIRGPDGKLIIAPTPVNPNGA